MTELEHYKAAYKQEKLRADLLQADLDRVDDLHVEELRQINLKIIEKTLDYLK